MTVLCLDYMYLYSLNLCKLNTCLKEINSSVPDGFHVDRFLYTFHLDEICYIKALVSRLMCQGMYVMSRCEGDIKALMSSPVGDVRAHVSRHLGDVRARVQACR